MACRCTCLGCQEDLILKRGPIKAPHFSHKSGSSCAGGVGYWHKCAQMALEDCLRLPLKNPVIHVSCDSTILDKHYELRGRVNLPGALQFTSVTQEDRFILPGYVVDVSAITPSTTAGRLIIEIKDTHALDHNKLVALKKLGIPAVEIDISQIRKTLSITTSTADFLECLFMAPRQWIVSLPEYVKSKEYLEGKICDFVTNEERVHLDNQRLLRLALGPARVRERALRGMNSANQMQNQMLAA